MRIVLLSLALLGASLVAHAQDKQNVVTVLNEGVSVLTLKVSGKAEVTPRKDKTVIHTTDMYLYLWTVGSVSNVTDGLKHVADVIKGEVLNFKPTTTTELTIGGGVAKLQTGPSTEADDGDAGSAEVATFEVGKRVFIACIHGEGKIDPKEHEAMLAVLQTATAP